MVKRINAPFYTETKVGVKSLFHDTHLPNGYLYSKGKHRTKIKPEDLPSHYIPLTIFKVYGYLSTKDIKDIAYKPNYHINHMHRDDFLYVSYNAPIWNSLNKYGFREYHDYDVILYGGSIVKFIRAIQQAQSYDIEAITEEVKKKERFFIEKYPGECSSLGCTLIDPITGA